jgi:hypothetical protein
MASKWRDFEADGDRYDLQYRTAADEKVRAEHAALHDTTLPVDDPFWNGFTPPNGWNCRCTVVQVRKDPSTTADSNHAVELGREITSEPKMQMFRFNSGTELKIFPDRHPTTKPRKRQRTRCNNSPASGRKGYAKRWTQRLRSGLNKIWLMIGLYKPTPSKRVK